MPGHDIASLRVTCEKQLERSIILVAEVVRNEVREQRRLDELHRSSIRKLRMVVQRHEDRCLSTDSREAGAHPAFPPNVVVEVKRIARELPTAVGVPLARRSLPDLRREVVARGLVATSAGRRSGAGWMRCASNTNIIGAGPGRTWRRGTSTALASLGGARAAGRMSMKYVAVIPKWCTKPSDRHASSRSINEVGQTENDWRHSDKHERRIHDPDDRWFLT